ncbi:MAG TPA: esterase-like activity of phytase family protein, partial [Spirochaetia bacterium]|nr:esterase-like activity of phytase family protein [Spirochaetia bacterium]
MKTVAWRWFLWTGMTLGTLAPLAAGPAGVEFLGLAALPGGDRAPADQSGLAHTLLEDGVSYQDRFDGFGSGLAWTGEGDRYLLLSDRGPNKVQYPGGAAVDFTTNYPNRFQVADIRVTRGAQGWKVEVVQTGTRLLKTEDGTPFTGLSTAFTSSDATKNLRLDSEGIRVAPDGTVWISDEYGPVVYHFAKDGRRIGTL